METSLVMPGRTPVSIMYWIMVIGLNQNRCRGRCGLSTGFMKVKVCSVAVAAAFLPLPPLKVMVGAAV